MKDSMIFVAEVACDHEGEIDYLFDLISEISKNNIPVIKFQAYRPEELVSEKHPDYKYFSKIAFDKTEWLRIINYSVELGLSVYLDYLGPFTLDLIRSSNYKIAGLKLPSSVFEELSFLVKNLPDNLSLVLSVTGKTFVDVVRVLRQTRRPIILSYGAQSFPADRSKKGGPPKYPITADGMSLKYIEFLSESFPDEIIGLSDHFSGDDRDSILYPLTAVIWGVRYIEKHVTMNRNLEREDYFSGQTPQDLGQLYSDTIRVLKFVNDNRLTFTDFDSNYIKEMSKQYCANRNIREGELLKIDDIVGERTRNNTNGTRVSGILERKVRLTLNKGQLLTNLHVEHQVGIFCNARFNSNRLPGKALASLGGLPSLKILLSRLEKKSKLTGYEIVFATGVDSSNDSLVEISESLGVTAFRGDDIDVMGRMVSVVQKYGWDYIIRVTGDDPFVDTELFEEVVNFHIENDSDFTQLVGVPSGFAFEVISASSLLTIYNSIVDKSNTEYLTWFLNSDFVCKNLVYHSYKYNESLHDSFSIDYPEDLCYLNNILNYINVDSNDELTGISSLHIFNASKKIDQKNLYRSNGKSKDSINVNISYKRGKFA